MIDPSGNPVMPCTDVYVSLFGAVAPFSRSPAASVAASCPFASYRVHVAASLESTRYPPLKSGVNGAIEDQAVGIGNGDSDPLCARRNTKAVLTNGRPRHMGSMPMKVNGCRQARRGRMKPVAVVVGRAVP